MTTWKDKSSPTGTTQTPSTFQTGVKQGCVLALELFNLFFTQVLHHAAKNINLGIYIRYRTDGSLFDLCRLSAKTKARDKLIIDVLFADDCALMAHKENHLLVIVDCLAQACRLFRLTISYGETEALLQAAPHTTKPQPCISIDGTELKCGEILKYLCSTISSRGSLDKEIMVMILKSSQALGRLIVKVLQQKGIRLTTKLRIYKAVVISSLLVWIPNMDSLQTSL